MAYPPTAVLDLQGAHFSIVLWNEQKVALFGGVGRLVIVDSSASAFAPTVIFGVYYSLKNVFSYSLFLILKEKINQVDTDLKRFITTRRAQPS
jgi:hypothetical protein